MKKYFCKSNAYNQLVFVDDTNNAIGFDASTKEEAENMDISGIIDLKTTEEIAHHCSRENDVFPFDEDAWDDVEEMPIGRKWVFVSGTEHDLFEEYFDTMEEAIAAADQEWNRYLTPAEKKKTATFYVANYPVYQENKKFYIFDYDAGTDFVENWK